MTTKPRHIYIQPPEIPSSTTASSPALINLAVALGEFKAMSGIEFDVEPYDRLILRVSYWQDEAFIALRLKFGHWFVEKPKVATRPPPPRSAPSPVVPRKKDDWRIDMPMEYSDVWERYKQRSKSASSADLAREAVERMRRDEERRKRGEAVDRMRRDAIVKEQRRKREEAAAEEAAGSYSYIRKMVARFK